MTHTHETLKDMFSILLGTNEGNGVLAEFLNEASSGQGWAALNDAIRCWRVSGDRDEEASNLAAFYLENCEAVPCLTSSPVCS